MRFSLKMWEKALNNRNQPTSATPVLCQPRNPLQIAFTTFHFVFLPKYTQALGLKRVACGISLCADCSKVILQRCTYIDYIHSFRKSIILKFNQSGIITFCSCSLKCKINLQHFICSTNFNLIINLEDQSPFTSGLT